MSNIQENERSGKYWVVIPYFLVNSYFYVFQHQNLRWYLVALAGQMIIVNLARGLKLALRQPYVWGIVGVYGVIMTLSIFLLSEIYMDFIFGIFITIMSLIEVRK